MAYLLLDIQILVFHTVDTASVGTFDMSILDQKHMLSAKSSNMITLNQKSLKIVVICDRG